MSVTADASSAAASRAGVRRARPCIAHAKEGEPVSWIVGCRETWHGEELRGDKCTIRDACVAVASVAGTSIYDSRQLGGSPSI